MAIELRDATYVDEDGHQILRGASLIVPPDSRICIVGSHDRDQPGLAALLLGLVRPGKGSIEVGGLDLNALPLIQRRALVAGVLQDPWLVDGTVADNIAFDLPGMTRPLVEAAAAEVGLDQVLRGVPGGLDAPIDQLGLGQRRAVALTRAVARRPEVLVLEEPTLDLDPDEERELLRVIEAATAGRTSVLLTRRLSLARRADTVVVIDEGRIVRYQGNGPDGGHARLWDTRVPPLVHAEPTGPHLRLVGRPERSAVQPTGGSWSITIGSEFIPGYLASGLLARTPHTETWVAWSIRREQPVRIKVPRIPQDEPLLGDPVTYQAWEQLSREYQVLQELQHPGVTPALEADLEAEMPYLVLEYLDSTSLARALQRQPRGLTPVDVLKIGFDLAGTLHHLHQRGHTHLNLRTGHVRTRDDIIVVTDFTQCRPIGSVLPEPTAKGRNRLANGRFFAPEFRPGRPADPKMDIYALGTLLHRATAGSMLTNATAGRDRPLNFGELHPEVPDDMAEVVDQMLTTDPSGRPDADEVVSQFRHILPRPLVRPQASMTQTRSTRLRLVNPS